ncbi:MAG: class I tRNA ligase family protein, partial [Candidatus Bathyarchaeia archaeon]
QRATEALENCQFNIATEEVRNFTWHVLCDRYIEAIKHRLYKPETYGEGRRRAAQYTLYVAIYRTLQLLAPISPHITEELYQAMYARYKKHKSIHVSPWPTPEKEKIDEEAEKYGDLVMAVIGEVRKDKAERRMPLNSPIKKLTIYAGSKKSAHILHQAAQDIAGTCKTAEMKILPEKGEGREVQEYPSVRFTASY